MKKEKGEHMMKNTLGSVRADTPIYSKNFFTNQVDKHQLRYPFVCVFTNLPLLDCEVAMVHQALVLRLMQGIDWPGKESQNNTGSNQFFAGTKHQLGCTSSIAFCYYVVKEKLLHQLGYSIQFHTDWIFSSWIVCISFFK